MKEILKELVTSKRVWGFVVIGITFAVKQWGGGDIAPEAQEALSDQFLLISAGVWTVITKILDSLPDK